MIIERFDVVDNDIELEGVVNCAMVSDRSLSVAMEPLSEDIDNISGGCVIEFYRRSVKAFKKF
jgi:hypothetical protein